MRKTKTDIGLGGMGCTGSHHNRTNQISQTIHHSLWQKMNEPEKTDPNPHHDD
jgi:hypothetical protein